MRDNGFFRFRGMIAARLIRVGGVVSLCLVALAPLSSARAQGAETLRGIRGVRVSVSITGDEARREGPAESTYREILEGRARSAGLRLTDDERAPRLGLVVIAQKYAEEGVYAVAIDLDLYQLVSMERLTAPPFHASTWRVTQVVVRPAGGLDSLKEVVGRAADEFVKEYLSANGGRN